MTTKLQGTISSANNEFLYAYRTVSVSHLPELQAEIEKILHDKTTSTHQVFRSYIADFNYTIPPDVPTAKFIIIIAVFLPPAISTFHYKGKARDIIIASPYYLYNWSPETILTEIRANIIKNDTSQIAYTRSLHLKLLAVRSGLAKYGRNNICYVGDMGSFVRLFAFFTDYDFPTDHWESSTQMMVSCKNCDRCYSNCPTQAIPPRQESSSFILNVDRCLPLYNEIMGEFPAWIPQTAHNSLMGCLLCQKVCPANRKALKEILRFDSVTENETQMLLDGELTPEAIQILSQKIRMFTPDTWEENKPILKRNLRVLLSD